MVEIYQEENSIIKGHSILHFPKHQPIYKLAGLNKVIDLENAICYDPLQVFLFILADIAVLWWFLFLSDRAMKYVVLKVLDIFNEDLLKK